MSRVPSGLNKFVASNEPASLLRPLSQFFEFVVPTSVIPVVEADAASTTDPPIDVTKLVNAGTPDISPAI